MEQALKPRLALDGKPDEALTYAARVRAAASRACVADPVAALRCAFDPA
ncbi:MAG: hypothetical protein Q8P18_27680 [Pseudomonadota bacterium]|nr:hypothetical protein [Pseudomonadota bacterium]